MSWAEIQANATEAQIEAVLAECEVCTSQQSSSTVLFAKNGSLTIRQRETQTVTEYRGLSEEAAKSLVGEIDNTKPVTYYANIDGDVHTITVLKAKANTNGKKTEFSASRSNEANGWTLIKTETEYTLDPDASSTDFTAIWKTTPASVADPNGVIISVDGSIQACRGWGKGLFTTNTVTVKEFRGLSLSDATTKAANLTFTNAAEVTIQAWSLANGASGSFSGWLPGAWYTVMYGTDSRASVKKDAEGLYTVTQTITEYDWTPKSGKNEEGWKDTPPA